jgi:hypothetical protein
LSGLRSEYKKVLENVDPYGFVDERISNLVRLYQDRCVYRPFDQEISESNTTNVMRIICEHPEMQSYLKNKISKYISPQDIEGLKEKSLELYGNVDIF